MTQHQTLMGQENEMVFAALSKTGRPLDRGVYVQTLIASAAELVPHLLGNGTTDLYLSNGGRLYIDLGHHPEWATPECTSPLDVVAWRVAGEQILDRAACSLMQRDGVVGDVILSRIGGDYLTGTTRGGHESYLVRRPLGVHAPEIIPHLVSRIVFTGAGGFDNKRSGARFMISPRVSHLTVDISQSSTDVRGIFHTKDEALCRGYYRMHVLSGENLQSHTADVLRMGTTALVALAVDAGARPAQKFRFADPLVAMRTYTFDPTCRASAPLRSGGDARAIDVQWGYLETVERFLNKAEGPSWGAMVCALWRDVLTRLDTEPASLDGVLDWRIKLDLFESFVGDRPQISWEDVQRMSMLLPWGVPDKGVDRQMFPLGSRYDVARGSDDMRKTFWELRDQLCELDLKFCRVGQKSLFAALERAHLLQHRLIDDATIQRAVTCPPAGRAAVRGDAIKALAESAIPRATYQASWSGIADLSSARLLDLGDPFMTETVSWTHRGPQQKPSFRDFF